VARRWLDNESAAVLAVRAVSPLTIAAVALASCAWLLLEWAWLFPQSWFSATFRATHGFIQTALVGGLPSLAVTLVLACGLGRLRLPDLGLRAHQLWSGIKWTVAIWLASQVVLAICAVAAGDGLALDPVWERPARQAGTIVCQLLGNSLDEEVLYRGFLLVQCILLARRFTSRRAGWAIGLVASQLLFGLSHIPQRWIVGDEHGLLLVLDLTGLVVFGIMFSLVFVRTGNLFIAIGVHSLVDAPVPVVASPLDAHAPIGVAVLAIVLAWPYLAPARYGAPHGRDPGDR
jgi:hypothetical protein